LEVAVNESVERASILVVEDSPAYQELYREVLEMDYDLQIVGSGEEARACLLERRYDVLLVDMRLKAEERGNTDGLDVAEFAHDLDPSVAIVLKSGYPTETSEIVHRLERIRAQVLAKSTRNQVRELLDTVSQVVSKQREN
jgi:DNA-binding NtrC family response regulator